MFFKIRKEKMSIFCARFLLKYLGQINNNVGFTFDLVHIIIDVVVLACRPYVHSKLRHTPFKEFIQSKPQNNNSI